MVNLGFLYVADDWLSRLRKDVRHTQKQAFAAGTLKNLKSQWKKFSKFLCLYGDCSLPITTDTLCLYIQYLSRSLKCKASVRNYVSGVKTLHGLLNIEFPSYDEVVVKLTFRGLDRVLNHVPQQAEPITIPLLLRLVGVLNGQDVFQSVVKCLFVFSFFLFARKSQFIPLSNAPTELVNLVTRQDIRCSQNMLFVTFRWTKTRQPGSAPLVIPLAPIPGSPLCPVQAFNQMVNNVPAPPSSPAFGVPSRGGLSPIVYAEFHKILRSCLGGLKVPPERYSSHSFRRGGATFAFSLGLPGEFIQSQGDWRSDSYKLYIDIDEKQRSVVAKVMAQNVSRQSSYVN